jgi:hypothetical protein
LPFSQKKKKLLSKVELVPTLMIDDAETKMRTEAALLFEFRILIVFFFIRITNIQREHKVWNKIHNNVM